MEVHGSAAPADEGGSGRTGKGKRSRPREVESADARLLGSAAPTATRVSGGKVRAVAASASVSRSALAEDDPDIVDDRPPVAVLVVDGDPDGRARLCQIIAKADGVRLTGSVATLADAVELARRTKPEVVLSELFLPDGDAAALKHRFVPLAPRPQLVVITRFSVRGARVASMFAGARTCLASTAPPDSVLAAVVAAANGESWDGAGVLGSRRDRVSSLEAKVLAGVASGATNDEIARALGYSIHYVKDLLEAVRHRLGAKDRAHAAALAVSLRLIRPSREGRFISAVPPEIVRF